MRKHRNRSAQRWFWLIVLPVIGFIVLADKKQARMTLEDRKEEQSWESAAYSTPSVRCVQCHAQGALTRELYCICKRAVRTYEGGEVDRVVMGHIAGIPFVMPSGFAPTVEVIEGEDLVVETPLPVCDECWSLLHGGTAYMLSSSLSQFAGTCAVLTLFCIMFLKTTGTNISLFWPAGVFAVAIPPFIIAEQLRSKWEDRLKRYMQNVPQYVDLLNIFPSLEVRTRRPIALMSED